jgi:serine/threonine protein kinase
VIDVGHRLDKYRLTKRLGEGGMGAVYAAENTVIGKKVAIKVLHPSFTEHDEALQRFLLEAKMAATLDHPGVVEIYDFGTAKDEGHAEFPFIVMELLRGRSLHEVLREQGPALDVDRCVDITADILSVLVAVHNSKIIHRDLKPENIFQSLRRDGSTTLKILDFGISKIKTDKGGGLTSSGVVLGTPYYMSPEQASGERDIDHRVDLWSVGAILYQMATGELPFPGQSYNEVLTRIVLRELTHPREINPEIPEWLERVILRAMTWDREERYRSAGEFAGDLVSSSGRASAFEISEAGLDETLSRELSAAERESIGQAETVASPSASVEDSIPTLGEEVAEARRGLDRTAPIDDVEVGTGVPVDSLGGVVRDSLVEPGRRPSRLLVAAIGGLCAVLIVGGVITYLALTAHDGVEDTADSEIVASAAGQEGPESTPQPADEPAQAATEPAQPTAEPRRSEHLIAADLSPAPPQTEPRADRGAGPRPHVGAEQTTGEGLRAGSQPSPSKETQVTPLTRQEVASVMRKIAPSVLRCLGSSEDRPPVVRVKLVIAGNGSATYQGAAPSLSSKVTGCLRSSVTGLRFRASGGEPFPVNFPYKTRGAKAPAASKTSEGSTRLLDNPYGD